MEREEGLERVVERVERVEEEEGATEEEGGGEVASSKKEEEEASRRVIAGEGGMVGMVVRGF